MPVLASSALAVSVAERSAKKKKTRWKEVWHV